MDSLGDRMKSYEGRETARRFMPLLPIYARLDGRNFSRLTRDLRKPYDEAMFEIMDATTLRIVEETGALVGYTQSDEISLLWYRESEKSQLLFDGKIFKIVSVVASLATSFFAEAARRVCPDLLTAGPVSFDCRALQLPNPTEATNMILWRERDATKNAINAAARSIFDHATLQGQSGADMQEMLFQNGINFNDYPARFKRGRFFLHRRVMKELDAVTLAKIPPGKAPDGPIERGIVAPLDMPPFGTVTNRVDVLFDGAAPEVDTE